MAPRAQAIVEQGEQTRELALDAAIDLFGRFGYRGASLNQIAKQAGIVQSGLHHHFGSKEGLLTEALSEHYPLSQTFIDVDAIAGCRTSFGAELVRVTEANVIQPDLVRFFSVMTGESLTEGHPAQTFFVERYRRLRARCTAAVIQGAGLPKTASVEHQIDLLMATAFAAIDGLQMQWLRDPDVDLVAGSVLVAEMTEARIRIIEG